MIGTKLLRQGFGQLACFIGDLSITPPTPAARTSMLRLLAWLAEQYDINTAPGAEVLFVSRGSNRWPAGSTVKARTISGHRDMSLTSCPGDAAYADLRSHFQAEVTALRARAGPPAPTSAPPPPAEPTVPPPAASQPASASPTGSPAPPAVAEPSTGGAASPSAPAPAPQAAEQGASRVDLTDWATGGVLASALATCTWAAWRFRRAPVADEPGPSGWTGDAPER